MSTRCCADCKQEFGPLRPASEAVALRPGDPGHVVPRLKITMLGTLCGACARDRLSKRRARQ